jgi:hypothetical protein
LTAAGSRTSATFATARTPSARSSAAVGSRCSILRLAIATSHPWRANASAMPRQMPVPPPVISATRLASRLD